MLLEATTTRTLLIDRPVEIDGDYAGSMATLTGTGYGPTVEVSQTVGVGINGLRITGAGVYASEGGGGGIRIHDSDVAVNAVRRDRQQGHRRRWNPRRSWLQRDRDELRHRRQLHRQRG